MIAELILLAVAGHLLMSAVTHPRRGAAIVLALGGVMLLWMAEAGWLASLAVGMAAIAIGVWRVKRSEAAAAAAKAVA